MTQGDQNILSFLDSVPENDVWATTFDQETVPDNIFDALIFCTPSMQLILMYEQVHRPILQYPLNPKSPTKQVLHWEQVFLQLKGVTEEDTNFCGRCHLLCDSFVKFWATNEVSQFYLPLCKEKNG